MIVQIEISLFCWKKFPKINNRSELLFQLIDYNTYTEK